MHLLSSYPLKRILYTKQCHSQKFFLNYITLLLFMNTLYILVCMCRLRWSLTRAHHLGFEISLPLNLSPLVIPWAPAVLLSLWSDPWAPAVLLSPWSDPWAPAVFLSPWSDPWASVVIPELLQCSLRSCSAPELKQCSLSSCSPLAYDLRIDTADLCYLVVCWGYKLESSHFYSEYFTCWAVFPTPQ